MHILGKRSKTKTRIVIFNLKKQNKTTAETLITLNTRKKGIKTTGKKKNQTKAGPLKDQ